MGRNPTGNKMGQPLKFKSAKELTEKINAYFEHCDGHIKQIKNLFYERELDRYSEACYWAIEGYMSGRFSQSDFYWNYPREPKEFTEEVVTEPYTITGLALWLECDIGTIKDYQFRDDYSRPIKEAYLRVQQGYEKRLTGNNVAGPIFALKNFEWRDKTEVEQTGNQSSTITIKLPSMDDDEDDDGIDYGEDESEYSEDEENS